MQIQIVILYFPVLLKRWKRCSIRLRNTSPTSPVLLHNLHHAISNTETKAESMKQLIQTTLTRDYGYRNAVQLVPEGKRKGLLAAARAACAPLGYNINVDEVEDFFDFSKKGDESCNDAVKR